MQENSFSHTKYYDKLINILHLKIIIKILLIQFIMIFFHTL